MIHTLNPTLPRWLAPDQLSPRVMADSPSANFERGLLEWEELRGRELDDPRRMPHYGYYADTLARHLDGFDSEFREAEAVRHDIRAGLRDPEDSYAWAHNTPPTRILEVIAERLGWRLVPLARWAGRLLGRHDIPHDVELACRDWAHRADAIWVSLKKLPASKLYRESHRAMVAPLRNEARSLELRTWDFLCQFGELDMPSLNWRQPVERL